MKCVAACKSYHQEYENLSAEGTAYTKVAIVDGTLPIPQLCLHCVDAPCVNTCITHALTQLDNGPVVLDRTKCIGCLICVDQCPFGSITFNPVDRKISKCEMCNQAVQQGKKPYCVRDCPTATLTFGSYDDKLAEGLKLAEQRQGVLLYPGDTNTLYVVSNTDLETFLKHPEVTIIKNKYPTDSRWIADLLKYSRVAWAPVALGAAFYILKWSKIEPGGKNET
jgi:Fe-S-cluster-containing dehydrogenase component